MTRFLTLCVISLAAASCGQPAKLAVTDAQVQLPAVAANPGAAYFTLRGGAEDETLVSVSTPIAARTELHESVNDNGVMKMVLMKDVLLQKEASVRFEPKGKHVMLFGIVPGAKVGDKARLTMTFAGGKTINAEAKIVGAGQGGHSH